MRNSRYRIYTSKITSSVNNGAFAHLKLVYFCLKPSSAFYSFRTIYIRQPKGAYASS